MPIIMKPKPGELQRSILRSALAFFTVAIVTVVFLVKNSSLEVPASSLRQRHTSEDEVGRTFTFELASLSDGKSGEIVIQTHPEWAPLGVKHFHKLMDEGFYDQTRFFRVVPDFIVQFGIAADPKKFPKDKPLKDDPVKTTNSRGTLTYATAGPNTRTTQLFINTRERGNAFLDKQGFSPFAEVISGMEYVDAIYAGYGEKPDQGKIESQGNEYLEKEFPLLSYITTAKSMQADDGTTKDEGGDN